LVSSLTDPDGDGRYTGSFVYNPGSNGGGRNERRDELRLDPSATATTQQRFGAAVQPLPTAVVRSQCERRSRWRAPSVAALAAQAESAQRSSTWWRRACSARPTRRPPAPAAATASQRPLATYRLDVAQSGYQPYRTADIAVDDGRVGGGCGAGAGRGRRRNTHSLHDS
jgi:hypothetical protein